MEYSTPVTPSTGRKRTFEYPDAFSVPPSPISPSKSRRMSSTGLRTRSPSPTKRSAPLGMPGRPSRERIEQDIREALSRPASPTKSSTTSSVSTSSSVSDSFSSPSSSYFSPEKRDERLKIIEDALSQSAKKGAATSGGMASFEGPLYTETLSSSPPRGFPVSAAGCPRAGPSPVPGFSTIAHSREVQRLMDLKRIPWGVQYEIARGVCAGRWSWDDVTAEKLEKMKTSNREDAPRVEHVILDTNTPRSAHAASLPLWYVLTWLTTCIVA